MRPTQTIFLLIATVSALISITHRISFPAGDIDWYSTATVSCASYDSIAHSMPSIKTCYGGPVICAGSVNWEIATFYTGELPCVEVLGSPSH